jgi:hypothetical protein
MRIGVGLAIGLCATAALIVASALRRERADRPIALAAAGARSRKPGVARRVVSFSSS